MRYEIKITTEGKVFDGYDMTDVDPEKPCKALYLNGQLMCTYNMSVKEKHIIGDALTEAFRLGQKDARNSMRIALGLPRDE